MRARDLLLMGAGAGSGWAHPSAVRALDFKNNRYMRQGVQYAFADLASVTRASTGWLDSIGGIWSEFLANVLRRTDRGAAIGGQFTNKIRNPRGEGGVVGMVGVTNKCTGYNAAPPALVTMGTAAAFNSAVTNMIAAGGDANALFGVVDDTAALQAIAATDPYIAAGLANGWLNGRVFEVNNVSGAVNANLDLGGYTGNTNNHYGSIYASALAGTTSRSIGAGGGASGTTSSFSGSSYARYTFALSSGGATNLHRVSVPAGNRVRVILFDLIEAATAAPVPTIVAGAAATGALPPNWTVAPIAGVATAFLGVGTEGGLPYADIALVGTAGASGSHQILAEGNSNAAAIAGQAWGFDQKVKALYGTQTNLSTRILEYASGSYVGNALLVDITGVTPPASPAMLLQKCIVGGATTTAVRPSSIFSITNGVTYNFATRIYAPKLVQIATVVGGDLVNPASWVSANTGTGTSSVAGNQITVNGTVSNVGGQKQVLPLLTGQVYLIESSIAWTSGRIQLTQSGTGGSEIEATASGSFSAYFVAPSAPSIALGFSVQTNASYVSSGVVTLNSVKQVTPGYMPAVPILPPVGVPGDSAKLADDVRATNLDWFTAAGLAAGATELVAVTFTHVDDAVNRVLFEISDGTANNYVRLYVSATNKVRFRIQSLGVTQFDIALIASVTAGDRAYAVGWSAAGAYVASAAETVTFGAFTLPAGLNQKRLGSSIVGDFFNDIIRRDETCRPIVAAEAAVWALAA